MIWQRPPVRAARRATGTSRRWLTARALGWVCAVLLAWPAAAAGSQPDPQDLKQKTLQELMQIEVTLVTRQPEPVGSAAAAVTVITREDIRRSGVTTIADAVALAEGMHVARFNNGSWAISARGFNGSTPNKLLLMVDGRIEFSPLFAGAFWNIVDYVLEDIERIEVIRGPGATMWGSNAVNGVVNIVTRSARDTRGSFVSLTAGNEDPAIAEFRYGGGSDAAAYRVYGKFAQRDAQHFSTGGSSGDTRRRGQAGFRLDAARGASEWALKGDAFLSRDELPDRSPAEFHALALQARLRRQLSPRSELQIQTYYRREYRAVERQLTHHLDTVDVDAQHAVRPTPRHHLIWGGGVRISHDATRGSAVIDFDPARRTYGIYSGFIQDEFAIRPDALFVTAGVKVEHNAFSGADWQPNLRARWLLPGSQVLWGAVARASRRPTRFDDDILVLGANGIVLVRGSDDFESEQMRGGEIGYRSRPLPGLAFDATVFLQDYDRLRSQEAPLTGIVPIVLGNTLDGRSSGLELAAGVQPVRRLNIRAAYTYLHTEITREADSRDVSGGVNEFNDPRHLVTLRTAIDLGRSIEADVWFRAVSELPNPRVPSYGEVNARLGWRPAPAIELALTGQDLLHAQHPEFGAELPRRVEFERGIRGSVTIRLP